MLAGNGNLAVTSSLHPFWHTEKRKVVIGLVVLTVVGAIVGGAIDGVKAHANMKKKKKKKKKIIISTSSPSGATTCSFLSSVAGVVSSTTTFWQFSGKSNKMPLLSPKQFLHHLTYLWAAVSTLPSAQPAALSLPLSLPFSPHLELHQLQEILSRSLSHFLHISSCINSKNYQPPRGHRDSSP